MTKHIPNLKVGDKIRIKYVLMHSQDNGDVGFTPGMTDYCGKICTIEKITKDTDTFTRFKIKEDQNRYVWCDGLCDRIRLPILPFEVEIK